MARWASLESHACWLIIFHQLKTRGQEETIVIASGGTRRVTTGILSTETVSQSWQRCLNCFGHKKEMIKTE